MSTVEVLAPMPAVIVQVVVNEGDTVEAEDVIVLLTIMKTETEVKAQTGGVIKEIKVKSEDVVDAGALLLTIESDSA